MAAKVPPDALLAGQPEVHQIIRLLQITPLTLANYHTIGEHLIALSERVQIVDRVRGWRKQVAEIVGKSEGTLNKCCQFYEKCKKGELHELETMGVGWAMLTVALAVRDKRARHRLLKSAKELEWSNHELQRAVQGQRGSRRGGGRPRKGTSSHGLVADLCELTRRTDYWLECHGVWSAHQNEYQADLANLSPDGQEMLSRALKDGNAKIRTQLRQCMEVLQVLGAIQEILAPGSPR